MDLLQTLCLLADSVSQTMASEWQAGSWLDDSLQHLPSHSGARAAGYMLSPADTIKNAIRRLHQLLLTQALVAALSALGNLRMVKRTFDAMGQALSSTGNVCVCKTALCSPS